MKEEESINDLARSRQENTELLEEARVKDTTFSVRLPTGNKEGE